MAACELAPQDKKAFVDAVGKELVRKHGKQKYYRPADVADAANASGFLADVHCWAYCIFTSPSDFASLHEGTSEACNYLAMRGEVLSELASGGTFSWLDTSSSWLEWPDIDMSGMFDWFDLPG
jgi:hypothetical protein